MTLRLILMRHAKSGWDDPTLSDHQRPLNARGVKSAAAMGDWIRAQGYLPDLILCSDANRTKETALGLQLKTQPLFFKALYLASAAEILAVLHQASAVKTVLMLGHNPGIGDAAMRLAAAPADDPDFSRYPTCATTVLDFDMTEWGQARFSRGSLKDFMVPRRLLD